MPAFLSGVRPAASPSRLTFAKWLASRDSPTTARSLVNRVWQAYFGTGIVATSEDLGVQCEAAVASGASGLAGGRIHGKRLEPQAPASADRELGDLSAVVASDRAACSPRDPYNRLLARGPRFRVDAELVRDIALSASGLLDPKIGGPSVCPPAPAFLFQPPVSYGPKVWNEATGIERYRRAFYTFRYRSVPYPMLQAFDAPNGDFACVRRTRSNTPLQALATLNEPIYLECARRCALDAGATAEAATPTAWTTHSGAAWRGRRARPRRSTLLELLEKQMRRFEAPGADAWAVATGDSAKRPQLPAGVKPQDLAGWTVVARVLLNLDETITKE